MMAQAQLKLAPTEFTQAVPQFQNKVLDVKGLTKSYKAGRRVLNDISFDLHAGEFVAVIGRSGAGKSTLLHVLNGTLPLSEGSVLCQYEDGEQHQLAGLSGKALRLWRANCGMIFQDFCLVPRLDVLTNVLLGRLSHTSTFKSFFNQFDDEDRARAISLLEWLHMLPHALQRAENLSGGQMQRVAICRALMQNPKILLADEPVASLDPKNTQRIMNALKKVSEEGIAVMVNLHSVELVKDFCTRAIGIAHGEIIFDGHPDQLNDAILHQLYGEESDAVGL